MRADLFALTPDDLATLSNRGTVKRAQRELEDGTFKAEMSEAADGTLTAVWPESITCVLPPNTPLAECSCSCPAVGVCRHLVQTVLYYQTWAAHESEAVPQIWNPGAISDDTLALHYRKPDLVKLRKQFGEPHVIELVRGQKPLARFHTLPVVVRFLVPGDPHYTVCNCAEPAPCSHVALAVWAFRLLPDDALSGIVQSGHDSLSVPTETLDEINVALGDLLQLGISGASAVSMRQLKALVRRCQTDGLIWPTQILNEIIEAIERYTAQDARFSAAHTTELIGELLLRCRAIRHPSDAVPAIFVRGSADDNITTVGTARLAGLGCGVSTRRGVTVLSAYLVDTDTGGIVAIQRETIDDDEPKPYPDLARSSVLRDNTLATIGARQMLIKGGKRTAEGIFIPGRAAASVMPGTFNWETLRAPLLADSFAESRARRAAQPPRALRPRRIGEDLAVLAIQAVEGVMFDPREQSLVAVLLDANKERAVLAHPYTSRGAEGTESLAWWLQNHPDTLRFVAGHVGRRGDALQIAPIACIFEHDGQRTMVQPWVDRRSEAMTTLAYKPSDGGHSTDPLVNYPETLIDALGELFLNGLQRADVRTAQRWQQLAQHGQALGFVRLIEPVSALADLLSQRQHQREWDWRACIPVILNLTALARFSQEEV